MARSGRVAAAPDEKWLNINAALRGGFRGLPADSGWSLSQLLAEFRGHRNKKRLPRYTIQQILRWSDAHHKRTEEWPDRSTGAVLDAPGETWNAVDASLKAGIRGLPGESSLALLLQERRGVRNKRRLPKLSVQQILIWADAHFNRTGRWPNAKSGTIPNSHGETWIAVNSALFIQGRGLRRRTSLAELLAVHRGVRSNKHQPRLSNRQILTWADRHHKRTGQWPHDRSGPVLGAPGESWQNIDMTLRRGGRGLSGRSSLPKLLNQRRGKRNARNLSNLTMKNILRWADAHNARTGEWPLQTSGPVRDAPGETWSAIDVALSNGRRGLAGGSSLARLLVRRRAAKRKVRPLRLTVRLILAWANAFYRRNRRWPTARSGAIYDAPGETWRGVDSDLRQERRGLKGRLSLAKLLTKHQRR